MRLKLILVSALILFSISFSGLSQNTPIKIGFTDVGYILTNLPEFKQIESQLKTHNTQLQNQLEAKVKELREKAAKFEKEAPTMTEVIRNSQMKDLQNLEQSIQEFQQNAQASSQQKERTLLQPQYERIQKAIDEVRVENGYDFIFNANPEGLSVILSADEDKYNVSDLVFKKLGVTPPAAGNTTNTTPAASSTTENKK
ncbi:MAG TPA: OmpH family outer membrane protein [Cytophagales bacterium]|nr:OmpH family outer membrane protein [Cytophagales bacterium]